MGRETINFEEPTRCEKCGEEMYRRIPPEWAHESKTIRGGTELGIYYCPHCKHPNKTGRRYTEIEEEEIR